MFDSAHAASATTTVLVVGDSNVIHSDNLLVACPYVFGRPFVTRAALCGGLSARTFTNADGTLEPRVLDALTLSVMTRGTPNAWLARFPARPIAGGTANSRSWWADDRIGDGVLMVRVGMIDLLGIVRTLPAGCDFALDDARFEPAAFSEKPVGPYVPRALVDDLIAQRVAPLARGLAILRESGFEHVYLHSLHPPTIDDVAFACNGRGNVQASLRYKVALALNAEFRAVCERERIRFLDMWDATTVDGVVDPRFELDGDHLNRAAAKLSMQALVLDLAARVVPRPLDWTDLTT